MYSIKKICAAIAILLVSTACDKTPHDTPEGTAIEDELKPTPEQTHQPITVPDNRHERAKDIVIGTSHACALLENGKVLCWGDNTKNQLKIDSAHSSKPGFVDASDFEFSDISAAGDFSCGIVKNDNGSGSLNSKAVCWGDVNQSLIPSFSLIEGGIAIAFFYSKGLIKYVQDICYISHDQKGGCSNELTTGRDINKGYRFGDKSPVSLKKVKLLPPIRVGVGNACATSANNGSLICWGTDNTDNKSIPVSKGKVVDIGIGYDYVCSIKSTNQSLVCSVGKKGARDWPLANKFKDDGNFINLQGFNFKRIFISAFYSSSTWTTSNWEERVCLLTSGVNYKAGRSFEDGTLFCTFTKNSLPSKFGAALGQFYACTIDNEFRKVKCGAIESTTNPNHPIINSVPAVIKTP